MIHALQLELPLRFYTRIQCSAAKLSNPDHHLRRKENGYYQMRIYIDRGPKVVGERMVFGLGTRIGEEARIRRDLLLGAMKKAGLVVKR